MSYGSSRTLNVKQSNLRINQSKKNVEVNMGTKIVVIPESKCWCTTPCFCFLAYIGISVLSHLNQKTG